MWLWQLYIVDVYVLGKATSYVCLFVAVFWTGSNRIPVAGVESMKVMVLTPHVMCTNSAVAYAKWCCSVCCRLCHACWHMYWTLFAIVLTQKLVNDGRSTQAKRERNSRLLWLEVQYTREVISLSLLAYVLRPPLRYPWSSILLFLCADDDSEDGWGQELRKTPSGPHVFQRPGSPSVPFSRTHETETVAGNKLYVRIWNCVAQ